MSAQRCNELRLTGSGGDEDFLRWVAAHFETGFAELLNSLPRGTGLSKLPESDDITALSLRVCA